jgi:hypothetical protein
MSQRKLPLLASSIAAMLVLALAAPAGTATPSLMRHVHMNGVSGPAYYSVVEGGYRPVVMRTAAVAEPKAEQVAEIADAPTD